MFKLEFKCRCICHLRTKTLKLCKIWMEQNKKQLSCLESWNSRIQRAANMAAFLILHCTIKYFHKVTCKKIKSPFLFQPAAFCLSCSVDAPYMHVPVCYHGNKCRWCHDTKFSLIACKLECKKSLKGQIWETNWICREQMYSVICLIFMT